MILICHTFWPVYLRLMNRIIEYKRYSFQSMIQANQIMKLNFIKMVKSILFKSIIQFQVLIKCHCFHLVQNGFNYQKKLGLLYMGAIRIYFRVVQLKHLEIYLGHQQKIILLKMKILLKRLMTLSTKISWLQRGAIILHPL